MKYQLTLEELYASKQIFYSVVAGSQAYGLANEKSDEDIRGYYYLPEKIKNSLMTFKDKCDEQVQDGTHDIAYYSLHRAFELLMTANPNQIELLWIPEDCVKTYNAKIMDDIMDNRHLFISQAAHKSHFNYAKSQIKKAKGCNKRVNNPQPQERPTKLDFCWFVPLFSEEMDAVNDRRVPWKDVRKYKGRFPARPEPLGLYDLSKYDVAKMEHMENTYRMYKNGRGVFRGPNEELVCTSITKEREFLDFDCLLIFNGNAYKSALNEWKSYWDWMKNRNEHRWVDQEKGNLDYDAKNMSHCLRLMMSSKHILTEGCPLVRFEGDQQKRLMSVKNGEAEYDDIMEEVNALQKEIDEILPKTKVPEHIDFSKINILYRHLSQVAEKDLVG